MKQSKDAAHPRPSPALHFLNTPEHIEHDAAYPDSLNTYAALEVADASPQLLDNCELAYPSISPSQKLKSM